MGGAGRSESNTESIMSAKEPLYIVKIGGAVLEERSKVMPFIQSFATAGVNKVLVHGGGRRATAIANDLGIKAPLVEGRRITDDAMLEVAVMVYGGLMNKRLVAALQATGVNAIGLTGADGNLIQAHKRPVKAGIDYGWAGDIDTINASLVQDLLEKKLTPVVASITHDKTGNLLNTNADTIATELALGLSEEREIHLVFLFEQPGVMEDLDNPDSLIAKLDPKSYQKLKAKNSIHSGMIPKLDNAFDALSKGVSTVRIGQYTNLNQIIANEKGTFTLITKS